MPLTLTAAIALAKNQLSDDGAWLVLLEIQFNDLGATILRLVRNTEDITWDSHMWTAFPFDIDQARQSSDGSVESLSIRVSNVLRAVQGYIESLDGMGDAEIIVRVVYSNELHEAAVIEETFSVGKITCDAEWVTLELTPENFWAQRCPRHVYARGTCRWAFKSTECGYAGATTSCNKTLAACAAMNGGSNVINYGAFPSIPGSGFDESGIEESVADA